MNNLFIQKVDDIKLRRKRDVSDWIENIFDIINLALVYFDKITNNDVMYAFLSICNIEPETINSILNTENADTRLLIMDNFKPNIGILKTIRGSPNELMQLMFILRATLTYVMSDYEILIPYSPNDSKIELHIINNINNNKALIENWKIKEYFSNIFKKHNIKMNL